MNKKNNIYGNNTWPDWSYSYTINIKMDNKRRLNQFISFTKKDFEIFNYKHMLN